MYSWSDDTSDWYGKGSYGYGEKGKDERDEASRRAASAGPRTYGGRSGPNPAMIDPHKHIESASKNPLVVAVDVTGSMARWPAEIFDRLPAPLQHALAVSRRTWRSASPPSATPGSTAGRSRSPASRRVTTWSSSSGRCTARAAEATPRRATASSRGGSSTREGSESRQAVPDRVRRRADASDGVPKEQIQRLLGDATSWKEPDSLATWQRVCQSWNVWFLRRPTRPARATRWTSNGPRPSARRGSSASTTSRGPWTTPWAWWLGPGATSSDFKKNMLARQDAAKVKEVAEKIRAEGPRVLACPSCAARIPTEAAGRFTCSFCGSTLEL